MNTGSMFHRPRAMGGNVVALAEHETMFGFLLSDRCKIDPDTGEMPSSSAAQTENYRVEYDQIRPRAAITRNRPKEVHLGLADPTIPTFESKEILPPT